MAPFKITSQGHLLSVGDPTLPSPAPLTGSQNTLLYTLRHLLFSLLYFFTFFSCLGPTSTMRLERFLEGRAHLCLVFCVFLVFIYFYFYFFGCVES